MVRCTHLRRSMSMLRWVAFPCVFLALSATSDRAAAADSQPQEAEVSTWTAPTLVPSTEPPRPVQQPLPIRRAAFDGSLAIGGEKLRRGLPELTFPSTYVRFGAADWVTTILGGATALTMAIVPPIEAHRRDGPAFFDGAVRNTLRAPGFQGRYIARDTSDVLLSLFVTYPFFVDALATAWWFRGNAEAARQMTLINAEALALVGAIQGITNVFAARERPYGRDCGGIIPEGGIDCAGGGRYRSFFSGHAAYSFAAASVMCSHHMNLNLFADKTADVLSCIVGYFAAGTTATLRVVGDMHYASDVITGSLVGTAIGLGIPWLHYHGGAESKAAHAESVRWRVVPMGLGASLGGSF